MTQEDEFKETKMKKVFCYIPQKIGMSVLIFLQCMGLEQCSSFVHCDVLFLKTNVLFCYTPTKIGMDVLIFRLANL